MTKAQNAMVDKIREYIIKHDCNNNDSDYEIKSFEVEDDNEYGVVWVSTVTGMKNDSGTAAALYCRNYRHIAIGKQGGLRAYRGINGDKKLMGWSDVMIYGYTH